MYAPFSAVEKKIVAVLFVNLRTRAAPEEEKNYTWKVDDFFYLVSYCVFH